MIVIKTLKSVEVLTALIGIIILESYALSKNINGIALITAISGISGLGGYRLHEVIKIIKGGKE